MTSSSKICAILPAGTQAIYARHRQDDRVEFTALEFSQARVDVAAQIDDVKIRAMVPKLRLTPQAAGADARAARKPFERAAGARDQAIARIFAAR